jgi:hypothetical protein
MNPKKYFLAALILTLLTALPAAATLTVYTDRNAWMSSIAGSAVTDDFSGETLGDHYTPFTTSQGVTFTALSGSPIAIQVLDGGLVNGSRELHFRDFNAGVGVMLPSDSNSKGIGFDYNTAIEPWTVQVGDRATVLPANSAGFIGYVDDAAPIVSFTLTGGGFAQGGISIDNLSRLGPVLDAGELHNQGVKYVLQHLNSLPAPKEVNSVILGLTRQYCASIGQDCSWLTVPTELPRDPQQLINHLKGSQALRNRAQAVFSLIRIRGQEPRNARSLARFEQKLNHLEPSYQRPLNARDSAALSSLISVAGASGRFWASTAEGGLGGGRYVPDPTPGAEAEIDWEEVAAADAAGCIAGAAAVSFTIFSPAGCAIGAVAFSAIDIANQSNTVD